MNVLLSLLNALTLLLVLAIFVESPSRDSGGSHLSSQESSQGSSQGPSLATERNDTQMLALARVEAKLARVERSVEMLARDSAKLHDLAATQSAETVVNDTAESSSVSDAGSYGDDEWLFNAKRKTSEILRPGTLTIEQADDLNVHLANTNSSREAIELRRQITIAINNDELRVEPGVIF